MILNCVKYVQFFSFPSRWQDKHTNIYTFFFAQNLKISILMQSLSDEEISVEDLILCPSLIHSYHLSNKVSVL